MKLFLQKKAKFSSAGSSTPRPPCLQRLGALPPNPHLPPVALDAPPPPNTTPHLPPVALDAPPPPNTTPQLRISGYAPPQYSSAVSHKKCVDLIEHQVKCLLECSFITLIVMVC